MRGRGLPSRALSYRKFPISSSKAKMVHRPISRSFSSDTPTTFELTFPDAEKTTVTRESVSMNWCSWLSSGLYGTAHETVRTTPITAERTVFV